MKGRNESPDPGELAATGRGPAAATRDAAARVASVGAAVTPEGAGLYRLLVESVREYAIFALDAEGYVLSWNLGAQRLKGWVGHEIIGRHFSSFYPPEDIAAGKPAWELDVATKQGAVEDEGWRVRKDGSRFWANVVITALRDEMGRLVGFAKVTRDLTERRHAEEALRASEERFRLLTQNVRDYGIFMLQPDGRIASWNDGAFRIKGWAAEEVLGRHFSVFYPPEDIAAGKPAWELEVAAEVGRFEDEGWRVRKDGTRFWANVVITALRNDAGRLVGYAKVTRDLTERRAAEQRALEDARRLAAVEGANRAKVEFLASMSHELRTPLNAIGGYVELMEVGVAGEITERQREYLTRIRSSQQHLLGIINDLLNYSRIEAKQVHYDIASVPVDELVADVVPLVEPQAAAKALTVERVPCPPELLVRADRTKAEQVLLNLLSNAVKFTPAGGTVTVSCGRTGDRIFFTVRDTGVGIPPDKQAAVFEPFVQLGRNLSAPHEGTGLGLAISRDLARGMHGDLTLESAPGAGSAFTFTLPAAK